MYYVFVGLGVSCGVVYVPAEGGEEGIDEFSADLGFVVFAGFVCFDVSVEGFDESEYLLWCGHMFLAFRFL